jgi:Aspartyl/Asparaginyl beta-hydroxylase
MSVNGRPYHMRVGELYRVDVSQRHSAVNGSSVDRIHLVFDIVTDERVTKLLNLNAKI